MPPSIGLEMPHYTFLDVETANSSGKICSIAVNVTNAKGDVLDESYWLVDPECDFNAINVGIHGITPGDVRGCDTFDMLWDAHLERLFRGSVVVAHSGTCADFPNIRKTLACYGIEMPQIMINDTRLMAQSLLNLVNNRLETVCNYYDITLDDHHNAMADTIACRKIFWSMVREFGLPEPAPYQFGSSGSHRRASRGWVSQKGR